MRRRFAVPTVVMVAALTVALTAPAVRAGGELTNDAGRHQTNKARTAAWFTDIEKEGGWVTARGKLRALNVSSRRIRLVCEIGIFQGDYFIGSDQVHMRLRPGEIDTEGWRITGGNEGGRVTGGYHCHS
ncbi:MAG: hypothetical protein WD004_00830 [Actinomycetota bacterium]